MNWKKRGVMCLLVSSFFTLWLSDFYRFVTVKTFGPPPVSLEPHEDTEDPPPGPHPR